MRKSVAIVGSGPAALMAADRLSEPELSLSVMVFEKRPALGRKILIAGSSGLNITHEAEPEAFAAHYSGPAPHWKAALGAFGPQDWIQFIEKELGIETFLGTSRRYFIRDRKAARMLQRWEERLRQRGVGFQTGTEVVGFEAASSGKVILQVKRERETASESFDAVCFCLGGGSYEETEIPLRWPRMFREKGIKFREFEACNVGYEVAWKPGFLEETEGLPLKGISFSTRKGTRLGELVITRYGIEGTPVYFMGEKGEASLDLKPQWSEEEVARRLEKLPPELSAFRRIKKALNLGPAALALIYHHAGAEILKSRDPRALAGMIKAFPLNLIGPRPLEEAISSAGGVCFEELTETLMIERAPGVFLAGEMLDWQAPTGGFLIQGCVSEGRLAAQGMLSYLGLT